MYFDDYNKISSEMEKVNKKISKKYLKREIVCVVEHYKKMTLGELYSKFFPRSYLNFSSFVEYYIKPLLRKNEISLMDINGKLLDVMYIPTKYLYDIKVVGGK